MSDYSDEAYFLLYENKASKMKGWQLANELAYRLESFDLIEEDDAEQKKLKERAMRQIEILSTEKQKRK